MNFNLYDLSQAWLNIAELQSDDEELLKALDTIEGAIEEKAHNIGLIMRNLDGGIGAVKNEIDRLTKMKKAAEKKKERLKEYLHFAMDTTNLRYIETPLFKLSIQKNPQSLVITNEQFIPERFKIIRTEIDKPRLKEALKNGEDIVGAILLQGESVRIR